MDLVKDSSLLQPDHTGTYMNRSILIKINNNLTFLLDEKYNSIFHSDTNGRQIRKLPKN